MRKILSIFAAMLLAFTANAAVINIDNTTANSLQAALNDAASGDEIVMAAGTYAESGNYLAFTGKDLTVRAAEGAEVIIQTVCPVRLKEGAKAEFINVKFDCSTIGEYEYVIVAADDTDNKRVVLSGCEFYGWNKNKAMIEATSSRRLASVTIEDCYFHDCMKSVVFIENTGSINLSITNTTFANISTNADSFWAGVIDSRATAGSLLVDHCTFYNVLAMNTDYAAIGKNSTPGAVVSNSIFMLPTAQDGIRAIRSVSSAINCITFNYLKDSGTGIHSEVATTNCLQVDPAFVDPDNGNFTLAANSPALTMNDGQPIGDPRWVPAPAPVLETGFYLVGSFNSWTPAAEYHLVGNPDNNAEFMINVTLAENDELKVVNVLNNEITAWFPGGNNYVVDAAHAGDKTVYFRPDYQGGDDWYEHCIYIAPNETPIVDEWAEIAFSAPATADEIDADASFTVDGFTVAITDPDNKMSIDANDCRFGTATDYKMYSHRLKSGGKSSATKNFMTLTIPEAGILRLAVRTGSNSATDRNLVLKQGDDTLYNQVIQESMAVKVMEGETEVSVYPFVEVPVEAGTVALSYPVNGLNFYAFAFKAEGGVPPVEPETIPTTAPAVPAQEEANVMAIYCNHYTTNNANFGISGWAGGYQTLDLNGTMAAYWTGMTWECIIDPVNTDAAHDFSAYENIHVDMWAPAAAKIKFTAEAVAGGNYKDGQVLDLVQGWNSFDIAIADWAGNYDFANLKCFALEQYQTPEGASFEGNPFAIANIYFWNAPVAIDTYTVAGSSAIAFGTTWDPANVANDMALQEDGTYKWEKENLELAEGEIAFKVCENHAWTHAWPAQDYKLAIPEAGVYTITITFNPAAESDHVAALATKTGEAVVLPTIILHGNFTGNWADTDPFVASADKLTASLTLNLAEGTYEFGFKFDGTWKANGANITREANTANLATGEGNMHITADVAGDYVLVYTFATQEVVVTYPSLGPEPLTIPTEAPVPTAAEEDVMAIFCNHYPNNNANFGISGWAGGYQILDLNGINVGYWTGMTWECIIDPAHTDDAHDFSAYKNIHVDLWAPLPAKIKFTAEAVNGGNYKDGQVVEMQQGWNNVDFVVAEWAGNYDFKNLKCFVFEQYQTLEGESFEGNPFAFANIYFYGKEEQGVENVNDVVKAVKMIENGQVIIIKNGVKYNVMGARVR